MRSFFRHFGSQIHWNFRAGVNQWKNLCLCPNMRYTVLGNGADNLCIQICLLNIFPLPKNAEEHEKKKTVLKQKWNEKNRYDDTEKMCVWKWMDVDGDDRHEHESWIKFT